MTTALEHIARAVCAAEGYEPDAQVMQFTPTVGAFGHPVVHGGLIAQWQVYEPVVRAVITTLFDAMPEGDDLKEYAEAVLKGDAEVTAIQPDADAENPNWRVFYGLKR